MSKSTLLFSFVLFAIFRATLAEEPLSSDDAYNILKDSSHKEVRERAERWHELSGYVEWADSTGLHRVKARYVSHSDERESVLLETARFEGSRVVHRQVEVAASKLGEVEQERIKEISALRDRMVADLATVREVPTTSVLLDDKELSVKIRGLEFSQPRGNVFYTSKPHSLRTTIRDGDGGYVNIQYDGESDTVGFFNVRGKPIKPTLKSSNKKVLTLSDRKLVHILGPGKATISVSLAGATLELPIEVIEIPIPLSCTQEQAIESLGFPTSKTEGDIPSQEGIIVDGVYYGPDVESVHRKYTHWRYDKYPGAILRWGDEFILHTHHVRE